MRRGGSALAIVVWLLAAAGCGLFAPDPAAEFDVSPLVAYSGDRVTLDASPSRGTLVDYRWEVNGIRASGRQTTLTLERPGIYPAVLTVEDGRGRTATVEQEIVIYARSGTRIWTETFSDGTAALGRWPLDPTWAVPGQSTVEQISGPQGYVLAVASSGPNYHRRSAHVEVPPLRVGQHLTIEARIMVLQVQEHQTMLFAPARSDLALPPSGFPYYVLSTDYGGSAIREPTTAGGVEAAHPVAFLPEIYVWHTYAMDVSPTGYRFRVDGSVLLEGPWEAELARGGVWWIVLGDESLTEECRAHYDDVVVSVQE
ncbi:MAG: PKD domain-containing protein [Candidatus Bipolaricaulota bacterium]